MCAGDNCSDYQMQFERVFSVPGDTVMLNSTLLCLSVFDFLTVPYNISWFDSSRGRELTNITGRMLVRGETLWFLNVTLEDEGEYVTLVRYGGSTSIRMSVFVCTGKQHEVITGERVWSRLEQSCDIQSFLFSFVYCVEFI